MFIEKLSKKILKQKLNIFQLSPFVNRMEKSPTLYQLMDNDKAHEEQIVYQVDENQLQLQILIIKTN